MANWPPFIDPTDLAPGDVSPHPGLPESIRLHIIEQPDDPWLDTGFQMLEDEFRAANEMEAREVIEDRLRWDPARPVNGCRMLYRMMLLLVGDECVAVRDHTAIAREGVPEVVVHLSHVLVAPAWRRRGLVALLRTLPVQTGRECARAVGRPEAPITLFCEMEPLDLTEQANKVRRVSYERAGFLAIGAGRGFMQPDFRSPAVIDLDPDGQRPVPLDVLFRRVGREATATMDSAEFIRDAELIYGMYGACCRPSEMKPCNEWLDAFRKRALTAYPLYPPTQVP